MWATYRMLNQDRHFQDERMTWDTYLKLLFQISEQYMAEHPEAQIQVQGTMLPPEDDKADVTIKA